MLLPETGGCWTVSPAWITSVSARSLWGQTRKSCDKSAHSSCSYFLICPQRRFMELSNWGHGSAFLKGAYGTPVETPCFLPRCPHHRGPLLTLTSLIVWWAGGAAWCRLTRGGPTSLSWHRLPTKDYYVPTYEMSSVKGNRQEEHMVIRQVFKTKYKYVYHYI